MRAAARGLRSTVSPGPEATSSRTCAVPEQHRATRSPPWTVPPRAPSDSSRTRAVSRPPSTGSKPSLCRPTSCIQRLWRGMFRCRGCPSDFGEGCSVPNPRQADPASRCTVPHGWPSASRTRGVVFLRGGPPGVASASLERISCWDLALSREAPSSFGRLCASTAPSSCSRARTGTRSCIQGTSARSARSRWRSGCSARSSRRCAGGSRI